jgi:hypothetical protein
MVVLFSENNSEGGLMQSDIMKPWHFDFCHKKDLI